MLARSNYIYNLEGALVREAQWANKVNAKEGGLACILNKHISDLQSTRRGSQATARNTIQMAQTLVRFLKAQRAVVVGALGCVERKS